MGSALRTAATRPGTAPQPAARRRAGRLRPRGAQGQRGRPGAGNIGAGTRRGARLRPTTPARPRPDDCAGTTATARQCGTDATEHVMRLRGAAARTAANMAASLTVPTATSVRAVPGQAAGRQPDRDQQPPGPRPRRQGLLHPPDRLRGRQGAGRRPGDERLLRRGRRQAGAGPARSTSTSASPSTCARPTAPASCSCRASRPPRRWTSASSGWPTRTSSAGPGPASSPSTTSPAPRSA